MEDAARPRSIRAIAAFEAAKGAVAFLVAGALLAIGPDALQARIAALLARFSVVPRADGATSLLDRINPETLHIAVAIVAAYGAMRLLEGWGLWHHRVWASWLGCIGAAAYLPFELYALWRHPDWITWGVFLLNLVIVAVLARDIVRQRRDARA